MFLLVLPRCLLPGDRVHGRVEELKELLVGAHEGHGDAGHLQAGHVVADHLAGDLDAVLIWSYRLFVLHLASGGILRDTPGLTANEAAQAAISALPQFSVAINQATSSFAAVRYGDAHASASECEQMDQLISAYTPAAKKRTSA